MLTLLRSTYFSAGRELTWLTIKALLASQKSAVSSAWLLYQVLIHNAWLVAPGRQSPFRQWGWCWWWAIALAEEVNAAAQILPLWCAHLKVKNSNNKNNNTSNFWKILTKHSLFPPVPFAFLLTCWLTALVCVLVRQSKWIMNMTSQEDNMFLVLMPYEDHQPLERCLSNREGERKSSTAS